MAPSNRITTGIPGLDDVVGGGLVGENTYLIVGGAGTGKTVLSFQWLLEGRRVGERCLYITLAEPGGKIERNVGSFGWALGGIELLDLTPSDATDAPAEEYEVFPPSDVERATLWDRIYAAVDATKPDRLVIDSVTQLRYLSTDEYQFRKQIFALVAFLDRRGCTSFLVFEPTELERETSVALAVDGIMRLRREVSPGRVIGLRSVEVEKLRGSDFMSGLHPMRITGHGIHVYPHKIESPGSESPGAEQLRSGVAELDNLLGGGIESGTATIVSGPCGAGKSTLGMQLLTQACADGKRAVLYAFEESEPAILTRCDGIGIPAAKMVERGDLAIVRVNPLQLYPDEFLEIVRGAVEDDGRSLVMIDSLRGYGLAMEEFGTMTANMSNLVTYLNGRGETTILVNEAEAITGDLRATEFAVSYIADNVILLRYAEYEGTVIKVIACLKKRLGGFQPELRRLQIGPGGVRVSERLEHLRGILTGVPVY
jgi:circadian clock protein KaiC